MTLTTTPTLESVILGIGGVMVDPVRGVVPVGTPVLRGPVNRAPQPVGSHVIITPVSRKRLRTNVYRAGPLVSGWPVTAEMEQGVQIGLQLDFYGDLSGEWSTTFATWWRSEYGVRDLAQFCAPLYADDGRQIPLVTGEEQYLDRWMVTAMLQFNPVTVTPQEYADTGEVNIINVDERYPPS